jgi:hypothetical protein
MTETTSENKKSPEYVAHSSTPKTEKEETTIDSVTDKPPYPLQNAEEYR